MTNSYPRCCTTPAVYAALILILCAAQPANAELQIPVENGLGYTVYLWLYSYPLDKWYQRTHLSHEQARSTADVLFGDGLQYILTRDLGNRETLFGTFNIDTIKQQVELSKEPSHLRLRTVMVPQQHTETYEISKWVPEQRTRTVKVRRWRREEREREVCVYNRRTRNYDYYIDTYQVWVPYYVLVERTYTICKPVREQRERSYTTVVSAPVLQLVTGNNVTTLQPVLDIAQ